MLRDPSRTEHLASPEAITRTAIERFGFGGLRPGQLEVIRDVLLGRPVVTVMPTGAGKSLCYQLPAVMLAGVGGVSLVVSPLIALMKDQVDGLRARGVEAAALTSAAGPAEQAEILDGIRAGIYSLVYVAPERFRSPRFLDALGQVGGRLGLLAIDEAHCISHWGHDFRPDYRRLGEAVVALEPPRLIALTATATPEVRDDIAAQLHMREPRFHVRGFDRPNLTYAVEATAGAKDKAGRLVEKLRDRPGGVALVYAATRKNAERYTANLQEAGMRVRVYHAGLADDERIKAQDAFMADRLDGIVATNAFGMGVDKPDIRLVVHADIPRSPEAYYQEAGRGGRDGEPTTCVLLFNPQDQRLQEFLIETSYPPPEVLRGLWKLLRDRPELGGDARRLRGHLPGEPNESVVSSALRILGRHGFVREDGDALIAVRPDPAGNYAPLDVDGLAQRADIERDKLRTMVEYAYHARCRRRYILEYFGDLDWSSSERQCAGCDNCLGQGQVQTLSDEQKRAAQGLLGLVRRLSGRFGRTKLTAIADGSDDDARFLELPEHGALRGHGARQIMDLLRALEGAGLLASAAGEYPTLQITRRGQRVADGVDDLDDFGLLPRSGKRARAGKRAAPAAPDEHRVVHDDGSDPLDLAMVERLRALRNELAAERSVPAYVIFSNKTLEAIARAQPSSVDELAAVPGIGPSRLSAYGDQILAAVVGRR